MAVASDAFVVANRYEVSEVIGRGGMGEVWRAHDRRLHRDVAIKFLRQDLAVDDDARRRFADEARNAARLTHPNAVLVLDTGEHEGQPFLVMECLPGRTLRDEIKQRGALPAEHVGWIASDVLGALAAAHAAGVVHRDVSPANILLTDTGRAKLADFGISKAAEDATVTVVGHVIGTPAYLSPERRRGEPATSASDVYALGVTVAEALTGQRPSLPVSPGSLPPEVESALSEDPDQRPTAAAWFSLYDETADFEPATTVLPVVGADDAAAPTMAVPALAVPAGAAAVGAPWWLNRRVQLWTVGLTALAGLLLLLATNTEPGSSLDTSDESTPPRPTVSVTPPTTMAVTVPPTTAISRDDDADDDDVVVRVGRDRKPGKGKGRDD